MNRPDPRSRLKGALFPCQSGILASFFVESTRELRDGLELDRPFYSVAHKLQLLEA